MLSALMPRDEEGRNEEAPRGGRGEDRTWGSGQPPRGRGPAGPRRDEGERLPPRLDRRDVRWGERSPNARPDRGAAARTWGSNSDSGAGRPDRPPFERRPFVGRDGGSERPSRPGFGRNESRGDGRSEPREVGGRFGGRDAARGGSRPGSASSAFRSAAPGAGRSWGVSSDRGGSDRFGNDRGRPGSDRPRDGAWQPRDARPDRGGAPRGDFRPRDDRPRDDRPRDSRPSTDRGWQSRGDARNDRSREGGWQPRGDVRGGRGDEARRFGPGRPSGPERPRRDDGRNDRPRREEARRNEENGRPATPPVEVVADADKRSRIDAPGRPWEANGWERSEETTFETDSVPDAAEQPERVGLVDGAHKRKRPVPEAVTKEVQSAVGARRGARVESALMEASIAFERERYGDALRLLRPLLEEAPDLAALHELLGLSLYRQEKWAEALRHLDRFVELTASVEQHPVMSDCHRALRHYGTVKELWEELSASSPSAELVAEGRIVMSGSLADQGKLGEAIALMERAPLSTKRPKSHHLRMWYALADLYERAGDLPRARELFGRVAAADSMFADVVYRLEALG